MSISSPIPVLQGDKGTALRADGEELLLRRQDDELRIPLAAIAFVHAEGRSVSVELTAPAGAEATVYRVKDVSAAAATIFADAVNAALPVRAEGEPLVDGSRLVVTRSLVAETGTGDAERDEDDVPVGFPSPAKWATCAAVSAVVLLAVVVGLLDRNWGRGIATLLLGELGVAASFLAGLGLISTWEHWYLRRYGITVDTLQVYRNGTDTNAYTDSAGVTRYIGGTNKGRPVQVAYHPRKPRTAAVLTGRGEQTGTLIALLLLTAIAALIDYGTIRLSLPAFTG
ncbi:hypothetical protein [Streptomyces virginiae]|uniref:hypothetical protein n=1 Tax=Streptomyces virginiae TaxID=1961 RepID=UPI003417ED02